MPSFAKLDNIDLITFESDDHTMVGASFHLEASAEEIVTMIRRVSLALHNSTNLEYAGFSPLTVNIYKRYGKFNADVVLERDEESSSEPSNSTQLPQDVRKTYEEAVHPVPHVEAEPSEYVMKEGRRGAVV